MRYKDVFLNLLVVLIAPLYFSSVSFCAQPTTTIVYPFYQGIREMGMGGASIAVVDDETALILNPAALGKLRTSYLTVLDPEVSADSQAVKTFNANNYQLAKTTDPQDLLNTLKNYPNKHFDESIKIFPSYVVPNFGIGLLGTYSYGAMYDTTNNLFDIRYRNDYALIAGYSFKFFDGIIKLGFNAKYITRAEVDTTEPTNTTGMSWGNLVNSGSGIGSDVGLILTGPWTFLPTISAVWHDVGDTSYNHPGMFFSNQPRPIRTEQTIDVGASISPILGNHVRMQLTAEMDDVRNAYKWISKIAQTHGGIEFNFYDRLFIRGGLNQGYWTAGLELDWLGVQLQAGSWGEEVGLYSTRVQDRLYGAKLAFRF